MTSTESAFLREPPAPGPSRPRFPALGARPRGAPSLSETAERIMVARTVRDARLRAGIAQNEMAGLLGISNVTLSRWENGRDPIPHMRRAQMAGLYGFDLSLVAGLDADAVALSADERALLTAFRGMSEGTRRALLELALPALAVQPLPAGSL